MFLLGIDNKYLPQVFGKNLIILWVSSIGYFIFLKHIFLHDLLSFLHAILRSETTHEGFVHEESFHQEKQEKE
jgi:hypothetical protein